METFVAGAGKDDTFWRKPLTPTMDGNTKVFEIMVTEGRWNVAPDQAVSAMMYNGMAPGPEIRVTEGDRVRVNCHNNMQRQTDIDAIIKTQNDLIGRRIDVTDCPAE